MKIFLSVVAISSLFGADESLSAWDLPFGPVDVAAISGNGRLTVGLNEQGRVTSCRWPSPGYYDQLDYLTRSRDLPDLGVASWHGAMWAVRIGGETHWLFDDPSTALLAGSARRSSTVVSTVSRLADSNIRIRQEFFVDPQSDLLVASLRVFGVEEAPEIFWYQNFSPCARLLPELPVGDWLMDEGNDFAAFYDTQVEHLYQFRPGEGILDTRQNVSEPESHEESTEEWLSYFSADNEDDSAVWIGTATGQSVLGYQCANIQKEDAAHLQVENGHLAGKTFATGRCNGALHIQPEATSNGYQASVFIGFGHDRDRVDTILQEVLATGYRELREANQGYWDGWLNGVGLSLRRNEDELIRRRQLLTIAQSTDATTGAIVRSPITQPPLAIVRARDTAWASLALDTVGLHERAGRALGFLGGALRRAGRPGVPRGSLPLAVYSNGLPAAPHLIVSVDAVSWLMSAYWRHTSVLQGEARQEFLAANREAIHLAGEYLANWSEEWDGYPVHSFQEDKFRDAQSDQSLIILFAGIESTVQMLASLGEDVNLKLVKRRQEIEAMILFQLVEGKSHWNLDASLAHWLKGIIPPTHRLWQDVQVVSGTKTLLFSALKLEDHVLSAADSGFPDVTESAFRLIAATHRIYDRSDLNGP